MINPAFRPFSVELSHDQTMRYLALRRQRRIGALWTEGSGAYFLAPLGIDRRDCADLIGVASLINLMDRIEAESDSLCDRKPVAAEREPAEQGATWAA